MVKLEPESVKLNRINRNNRFVCSPNWSSKCIWLHLFCFSFCLLSFSFPLHSPVLYACLRQHKICFRFCIVQHPLFGLDLILRSGFVSFILFLFSGLGWWGYNHQNEKWFLHIYQISLFWFCFCSLSHSIINSKWIILICESHLF